MLVLAVNVGMAAARQGRARQTTCRGRRRRSAATPALFSAARLQFGKYLVEKQRPEWSDQYVGALFSSCRPCMHGPRHSLCHCAVAPVPGSFCLCFPPETMLGADYKGLKDLIKQSAAEEQTAGVQSFSPRTTSLTVQRAADRRDSGGGRDEAGCRNALGGVARETNNTPTGVCFPQWGFVPSVAFLRLPISLRPAFPLLLTCLPPPPAAEERFFQKLEAEVEKCGAFTARLVGEMRERLKQLQGRVRTAPAGDETQREQLLEVRGVWALPEV